MCIRDSGYSDQKITECRGRDHSQITIADRNRHRVFEVGRQLIQEEYQWITAQQLFPRFRAGGAEQRGYIAGKLERLAELFGNGTPDSPGSVGVAPIEAHHTTCLLYTSRCV